MKKENKELPKILLFFLKHMYLFSLQEGYSGDLEEEYLEIRNNKGKPQAFIWIGLQLIRSIPVFIFEYLRWSHAMLKNYFKTTIRNIVRHKSFAFINITGLATGIAVSTLMFLYVYNELTYDNCHQKRKNLYRIATSIQVSDRVLATPRTAAPLAPALVEEFPEVVKTCRLSEFGEVIIKYRDKLFKESEIYFADPSVFDIFTIQTKLGNQATFLTVPYSMIITDEIAAKYFGNEDPVGKIIVVENKDSYTVTGVVKKLPENSHFKFNMLASMSTLSRMGNELGNWGSLNFYAYLELMENPLVEELNEKITGFLQQKSGGIGPPDAETKLYLQPFTKIHLYSNLMGDLSSQGSLTMIHVLTLIGLLILLIACINFMNLSTARSAHRLKEIGVRKVLGANKGKMITQFLVESCTLVFFSLFVAMILIQLLIPVFNQLTGKNLTYNPLENGLFTIGLIILTGVVGLLSGSYPAFYLSSFKPVDTLQSNPKTKSGHAVLRNLLVNFQFIISIALICSTVVIYSQLHFIKNQDLGFNNEHVVVIPLNGQMRSKQTAFKTNILEIPNVINATRCTHAPGRGKLISGFTFEGLSNENVKVINYINCDEDYLETMMISPIAGRNFSREKQGDQTNSVLINEALVKEIGWNSPLHKKIFTIGNVNGQRVPVSYSVIGVIPNFHFESFHTQIQPVIIRMDGEKYKIAVRIRPENISETVKQLEQEWIELEPNYPFEYYFLDEMFDYQYRTEQRMGQIFTIFSIVAVGIACLGLFGLASFTAEKRTKEIGIRKVLGASIPNILAMLTQEFTKWILLSNIIAWPIAYFTMKKWLQTFAYRIDLEIWIFLFSGLIALIIAVVIISTQTIRAANTNPVNSLKYE